MSLSVINLVLFACLILAVTAVSLATRKMLRRRVARLEEDAADFYFETLQKAQPGWDPSGYIEDELEKQYRLPQRHIGMAFVVLNVATTIFVLVPLGFAAYNLLTNQQQQALQFNVIGLVTLVVTKGGVLLLSLVIKPAIKGASGYIGMRVAQKVWEEREKRKPRKG